MGRLAPLLPMTMPERPAMFSGLASQDRKHGQPGPPIREPSGRRFRERADAREERDMTVEKPKP